MQTRTDNMHFLVLEKEADFCEFILRFHEITWVQNENRQILQKEHIFQVLITCECESQKNENFDQKIRGDNWKLGIQI